MSRKDEVHSLPQNQVSKYNYEEEQMALSWLQTIVAEGDIFNEGMDGMKMIGDTLRDGVYLCKLLQKLAPQYSVEINEGKDELSCKENIDAFLRGCQESGLDKDQLFETSDLYDGTKLYRVVKTLLSMKEMFSFMKGIENFDKCEGKSHPRANKSFRFSNILLD